MSDIDPYTSTLDYLLLHTCPLHVIQPSEATPAIPRLAYDGRLTLLAGREGSGKSTLIRAAVAAATNGRDWLDPEHRIQPVRVLWVGEERHEDIRAEFDAFDPHLAMIDSVSVDDVLSAADLPAAMAALGARVAVVDPIGDLLRLQDERSYSAVRAALRQLVPRTDRTSVIGIMHAHREREMRADSVSSYYGSVGFGSVCDLLLDFKLVKDHDTQRVLRVAKSRCRAAQKQGTQYFLEFDGNRFTTAQPVASASPVPTADDIRSYKRANPATGKTAVAKHFGFKPGGTASYKAFCRVWEEAS